MDECLEVVQWILHSFILFLPYKNARNLKDSWRRVGQLLTGFCQALSQQELEHYYPVSPDHPTNQPIEKVS